MTGVLIGGNLDTDTDMHAQKEDFVKRHRKNAMSQWKTGLVHLHAKESQRLPRKKPPGAGKGA